MKLKLWRKLMLLSRQSTSPTEVTKGFIEHCSVVDFPLNCQRLLSWLDQGTSSVFQRHPWEAWVFAKQRSIVAVHRRTGHHFHRMANKTISYDCWNGLWCHGLWVLFETTMCLFQEKVDSVWEGGARPLQGRLHVHLRRYNAPGKQCPLSHMLPRAVAELWECSKPALLSSRLQSVKSCCHICGALGDIKPISDELKRSFQTVHPICTNCSAHGKKESTRGPRFTGKKRKQHNYTRTIFIKLFFIYSYHFHNTLFHILI